MLAGFACCIALVAGVHGWAERYFLDEAARQGRAAIELHREVVRSVKAALPWLCILFVFLIMVTYIPWLSTFVPTYFMGPELITK